MAKATAVEAGAGRAEGRRGGAAGRGRQRRVRGAGAQGGAASTRGSRRRRRGGSWPEQEAGGREARGSARPRVRRCCAVAAAGRGRAWRAGDGRLGAAMCGRSSAGEATDRRARGHARGEEVGRDVGTREGEEGARRPWPHRRRRVWAAVVEGG